MMFNVKDKIALILAVCLLTTGTSYAEPLGIRTNNPGNIIKTSIQWRGEVECNSRFECFDTARAGIRAMSKNLISYQDKHKLNTISKIIRRWSPPNENNTRLLSHVVRSRLHITSGSIYNLRSGDNLKNLVIALIKQENGYNPYSNKMIEEITNEFTDTNGSNNHVDRGRSGWHDEDVGDEGGYRGEEERVPLQDESIEREGTASCTRNKEREVSVDTEGDSSYLSFFRNFITKAIRYLLPSYRRNCGVDTVESRIPIL